MSPSTYRSAFLAAAAERGYIHQCTDFAALDARLAAGPLTAYVGYDCTADSLHIGNLLSIMLLRLFQKTGNKPIVLMGGGTTQIGDPSGKDEARQLLDDATIASNMAGIRKVFAKFLQFGDGPTDAVMVNNADWLDELRYIPFLRDVGRHFSVNRMLTQDSVRLRLDRDQPLSFLEFNYLILQAYDFAELARRFGCELQMGGSDQWGNIVAGVELGRRSDGHTLFGLTTPLLTTASGAKMGKSAQGAVWLNAERLSPYDYWQFWRNTEDADVGRFLRLYHRIAARRDRAARSARRRRDQRGEEGAGDRGDRAGARARRGRGRRRDRARGVRDRRGRRRAAADRGAARRAGARHAGLRAVRPRRLAASNSEARRLIKGGGARINDKVVSGETTAGLACRSRSAGSHQAQRRPQAPRAGAAGVDAPEAP